jgi:hypothetical protein
VRYEWLAQYCFDGIAEVQDFATRWIWNYNYERTNMTLGGITPKQRLDMPAKCPLLSPTRNGEIDRSGSCLGEDDIVHFDDLYGR